VVKRSKSSVKRQKPSPAAKKAAHAISTTAKRVARATKKAAKVARVLGKQARVLARPDAKVEVSISSKSLGEAPEKYHFVLHDGRHLRSLYELVDELETMSDDTFRMYANEAKNDFSTWVRDVFDEKHLAEDIQAVHHRIDMQRAVLKHLVRDLRKVARSQKR
jgi:hypothetical protein